MKQKEESDWLSFMNERAMNSVCVYVCVCVCVCVREREGGDR